MAAARPKQLDLGGPAAWRGGVQAIENLATPEVVFAFVQQRLRALMKVVGN